MTLLAALLGRTPCPARVALVVAHPDDETIAAGGSLHLLPDLLLVHVTDGAPRGLGDAARAGFATPAAYAAARQAELAAALAVAGAAPERVALGVPDQDASLHMGAVTAELAALFARHGVAAVLTHAYEGGHPDHDAVAFCVAQAAGGREVVEFPAYHAGPDGSLVTGRFLPLFTLDEWRRVDLDPPPMPGKGCPPGAILARDGGSRSTLRLPLTPAERTRKQAMLACFRTQQDFLQHFPATHEAFRPAAPDFGVAPHPGPLNYERWGWPLTGARWRGLARKAHPCAA